MANDSSYTSDDTPDWLRWTWILVALLCEPLALTVTGTESITLPPFRVEGRPARAHVQGLEIVTGSYLVTARQEDVQPRRPLLLRTSPGAPDWEIWDLPVNDASLDHPGGLQSDGQRLWIPVAESRRQGRSVIQSYSLAQLIPGSPLKPEFEFAVPDHIGAVAVSLNPPRLLGASWDTATVYQWDHSGQLQMELHGGELHKLGLGFEGMSGGLTVQDWKWVGPELYLSGLFRQSGSKGMPPASRLIRFPTFPAPSSQAKSITLPLIGDLELAREGMAVAGGWIYFLPEDLGPTNRVFRIPAGDLDRATLRPDPN